MDILSARNELRASPVKRTHSPRPGAWRAYRDCLRLEFEFTCAFCLSHESEVVEHGSEGSGLFAIEHYEPKSLRPDLENEYRNLFYICRYCNGTRLATPVQAADGRRLLDPCQSAWTDHFAYESTNFRLEPLTPDGQYTEAIYVINAPRKVEGRKHRFEVITERAETLEKSPGRIEQLKALLDRVEESDKPVVLAQILREQDAIVKSREDLQRYLRVPQDAPASCRCAAPEVPPTQASSEAEHKDSG